MKEKIIEILKDNSIYYDGYALDGGNYEIVAKEIEKLLPQWVSVEDRLPEEESQYLCRLDLGKFTVGVFDFYKGDWQISLEFEVEDITHWMPLPEPPKEK